MPIERKDPEIDRDPDGEDPRTPNPRKVYGERVADALSTLEDVAGGGSGPKAATDSARVSAAKALTELDLVIRETERICRLRPEAVRRALGGVP